MFPRFYCALLVLAALMVVGAVAETTADASAEGAAIWPFSSSSKPTKAASAQPGTVGGTVIQAGKTKVLASACPAGYRTKLKRFQLTATDMKQPVAIGWNVNETPLAASTTGYVSPPLLASFFTSAVDQRIVITVRCVSDDSNCGANIEGEFLCTGKGKDQNAGFGTASAQVPHAGAAKQVQVFQGAKPSGSFLQVAGASSVISKLKSKIADQE